ncbi:MAG: metallophosphoesterase [Verrucomicrobiaceae bacterium]|nr:MAG: metallophosphoesterase [Verrucomicrobiaceae bacterium]
MHFVQLIILGIPLLSLAWWWWADRRLKKLGAGWKIRLPISLSVALMLAGFVWVLLGRNETVATPVPAPLYALVLLWGLIFLPALALPSMLGWSFGAILLRIFKRNPTPIEESAHSGKWSRRQWLGTVATTLPVLATYGTAAFSLPRLARFRILSMDVPIKDLPPALDGVRIAHLTDTHVGKFTRGKILDDIVTATNGLDADLILFTGDLIDNAIRDLPYAVGMLKRLKAKSGVFVIEGNHDLFDDPVGFARGVRESGVPLLRNEVATVSIRDTAVQLLGIIWNRGEEEMAEDVDTVAALRDPDAFSILMAHHPHAFDRAAEIGIPLTLAGHTHGGQLMLSEKVGAGPMMFRYWSGLYQKAASALVVGNGTGNWFPLRVNAPAEILHLTLRKA